MANNERRQGLNELNARLSVVETVLPRIEEYMRNGVELRVKNTGILANIQSACKQSQDYQERCDLERVSLGNRVTNLESFKTSEVAKVSIRSSIIGSIFTITAMAIAALGVKFGTK